LVCLIATDVPSQSLEKPGSHAHVEHFFEESCALGGRKRACETPSITLIKLVKVQPARIEGPGHGHTRCSFPRLYVRQVRKMSADLIYTLDFSHISLKDLLRVCEIAGWS